MTGWRLGFAVVNTELAALFDTFMANAHSCTATFTQYAGIEALTGPPQHEAEKMRLKFLKRRDLVVTELNRVPGFRCHMPPRGGHSMPFPMSQKRAVWLVLLTQISSRMTSWTTQA